MYVVKGKYS